MKYFFYNILQKHFKNYFIFLKTIFLKLAAFDLVYIDLFLEANTRQGMWFNGFHSYLESV